MKWAWNKSAMVLAAGMLAVGVVALGAPPDVPKAGVAPTMPRVTMPLPAWTS